MSMNDSFSSKPLETTSAKHKTDKVKGGRPRMPIWNDFIEGEDDRHRHFGAICAYWTREKAHLALHCKGLVPDNIRRRWLIEVAKRGEKGDLLYNFIITTPNCHEYLYALADYSREHQTGNFIANKISDIIKKIGPHRFAAIVMDNGSNVHIAREIIHNNYSQTLNIHCVAHALNLLTADLDTISSMNIKGGLLETYCETCWVSIYDTTNSIVHVRPAIDKILEEKLDIFTNQEVFKIVCDEDDIFYTSCKRISLIFEPIKRVINLLESCIASLADCFMEIVQIAIALKKIPASSNFRTLAIVVFNFRYHQHDIFPYILTYFLHSNYRNQGLKKGKFLEICELAAELMSQLIKYKAKAGPWKLEYSSNLTPSLWWDAIEDEHTDLQKLAKTIMAQLYSYYISNVEKESKLHDDFMEIELYNSALNETIFAEIDNLEPNKYEEEDEMNTVDLATNDITMALQDLVDLSDLIFGADNTHEEPILTDEETSMEFNTSTKITKMQAQQEMHAQQKMQAQQETQSQREMQIYKMLVRSQNNESTSPLEILTEFLEEVVNILKPFEEITRHFSGSKYPTMNFIYPYVRMLKNKYFPLIGNDESVEDWIALIYGSSSESSDNDKSVSSGDEGNIPLAGNRKQWQYSHRSVYRQGRGQGHKRSKHKRRAKCTIELEDTNTINISNEAGLKTSMLDLQVLKLLPFATNNKRKNTEAQLHEE
ncbi:40466_t:CDS:10, partial [Gigaspora margarita]